MSKNQCEIEFDYKGSKNTIKCNKGDKMKDIFKKYGMKAGIDIKSKGFIFNNEILTEELTLDKTFSPEDIQNNLISIKVMPLNEIDKNKKLSNKKPNLPIQNKDNKDNNNPSKAVQSHTSTIDNNSQATSTFNTNKKDKYICDTHQNNYSSYCNDCKKDICLFCEKSHNNHEIISFGKLIPDIDKCKNNLIELKNNLEQFKKNIKKAIEKLNEIINKIIDNCESNYKTGNNIISNFDIKNLNFNLLHNINEINDKNNFINNDLIRLNNAENIYEKISLISTLYDKIYVQKKDIIGTKLNDYNQKGIKNNNENLLKKKDEINIGTINEKKLGINLNINNNVKKQFNNEITLIYNIKADKGEQEQEIKIFASEFIKNNKDKCKIIFNNKEMELKGILKINNCDINNDQLKIILKGINKITDASHMFDWITSLISLPDIDKWDTSNVVNMDGMFHWCISESNKNISFSGISNWDTSNVKSMKEMFQNCSLEYLPDISKWNVSNVTNMNYLFGHMYELKSLPDISKWNTSNVKEMNHLFTNCTSLTSLPDISKWNVSNVTDMNYLFFSCYSLEYLPDLSKWDISSNKNLSGLFSMCKSLKALPDISKWDISNVTEIKYLFDECEKLSNLPDISKWDTSNVKFIDYLFNDCKNLKYLPNISKWDTSYVESMSGVFCNCISLIELPNISKWDTSYVKSMDKMFYKCTSLSNLPNLSYWNLSKVENMDNMFGGCKKSLNVPKKLYNHYNYLNE